MKRTPHEEMLLGNSLYNAQDTPLVKVVHLSRKHSYLLKLCVQHPGIQGLIPDTLHLLLFHQELKVHLNQNPEV